MSWAARRRFFIVLILAAVALVILAIIATATFYKAPSCTDNIQNQGEAGIDCGASCPYLCTVQEESPTVLFTQALPNTSGRTDVVALVENKNLDAAARNVPYHIKLYGSDQALLGEVGGMLDLPPGATQPIYVPGVAFGKQVPANAFLDIAPSAPQWFRLASDPRIVPTVSNTTLAGTVSEPHIEAILTNPSVTTLINVHVIVVVKSGNGNVIGASATVVTAIPAQGSATATFTWNAAFPETPVSIDVEPIVPLPSLP